MAKEVTFLYQALREEVGKKTIGRIEIPPYIRQNLNPNFEIRPYQAAAFQHFMAYMEEEHDLRQFPTHLLFQMATGSGKTMMMAGLMLYLYEKGYRNFLFFVNNNTIIEKTIDNFMNGASPKYLFAPQIKIGDKNVSLIKVDNFQGDNGDDIAISFQSIQGLFSRLKENKENKLTFEDFEGKKFVLLADEAHHLSAATKQGTLALDDEKNEKNELFNWEQAVMKIFKAHEENLLIEFTATAELTSKEIANKYMDKLLYDYPLAAFRRDGYSKEVEIFKSDSELMERALQAVLLSHYRKKLFAEMGFDIKPVILFKSKNIDPSKAFMEEFIEKITMLRPSDLEHIKQANSEGVLRKVFDYLEAKKLDFQDLIEELKIDFGRERCVSANDDKEKAKLQIQLNTLESPTNPIRAVFAVDKLNEGWDVLNLFDIVRLYGTPDAKGKITKSTAAEAQLIGRGARYCPFPYSDIARDKRKFDKDLENLYRVCETMYYHSNNDSGYIREIEQALIQTGIMEENKIQVRLSLKKSFEASDIYQKGLIFLNEQEEIKPLEIALGAELRKKIHTIDLHSGKTATSKVFKDDGEPTNKDANISKNLRVIKMSDLGTNVVRKAMHQIKGFEYNHLQRKFQRLEHLNEFITSGDYLANIEIHLTSGKEIGQADKLRIAKQVLQDLHIVESSEERQFKGTKLFKAMTLKSVIKEKVVNYPFTDSEVGNKMSDTESVYYDPSILTADWYAFEDCYGTSEEKSLVRLMKAKYAEMKDSFEMFYLVRNERHFAIYEFEQGRRFEPDFVLFLTKKDTKKQYQIFIEPKGEHLASDDKWKENFLIRLHDEASIEKYEDAKLKHLIASFWQNNEFTVWGLPFYNKKEQQQMAFSNALGAIVE